MIEKYGRRELERFAYFRIYKNLRYADMRRSWQNKTTDELKEVEEYIEENPEFKRWLR